MPIDSAPRRPKAKPPALMQPWKAISMKPRYQLLLAGSVLLSLSACSASPPPVVSVADRCPPMAADVIAESKRKPQIKGETAVEVAGRLVNQQHVTRNALKRSIALYDECRRT
jgi:hypothetical protein